MSSQDSYSEYRPTSLSRNVPNHFIFNLTSRDSSVQPVPLDPLVHTSSVTLSDNPVPHVLVGADDWNRERFQSLPPIFLHVCLGCRAEQMADELIPRMKWPRWTGHKPLELQMCFYSQMNGYSGTNSLIWLCVRTRARACVRACVWVHGWFRSEFQ